jgi:hypothetical protein
MKNNTDTVDAGQSVIQSIHAGNQSDSTNDSSSNTTNSTSQITEPLRHSKQLIDSIPEQIVMLQL